MDLVRSETDIINVANLDGKRKRKGEGKIQLHRSLDSLALVHGSLLSLPEIEGFLSKHDLTLPECSNT